MAPVEAPGSAEKPRLTDMEKKSNHIQSEQKRRSAIRDGFDALAEATPGMKGQGRSEAIVLEHSIKYVDSLLERHLKLVALARQHGLDTSAFQMDD
ncbi:hypothetical protein K402DRAFT_300748, partial [Aulographum hederae CBS 113979]